MGISKANAFSIKSSPTEHTESSLKEQAEWKKKLETKVEQIQQVEIPEAIHLEFLPSHSPEFQPAERLWALTNEPIANRSFENFDEVEEVLIKRCRQIIDPPEVVRGLTNFFWGSELGA
jgi:transposase